MIGPENPALLTPHGRSPATLRQTHTFVILEVPKGAFDYIQRCLLEAQYEHAFQQVDGRTVIDMSGIAIAVKKK